MTTTLSAPAANGRTAGNDMVPSPASLPAPRPGMMPDQINLLKDTICAGSTDDELRLFIAQCNRTGLDPFVRQIHAVKRWDAQKRREVMSVQVGIDGLRLIADRTGQYAPGPETEFTYDVEGVVVRATSFVKKWVHGEWHIISESAYWSEYVQYTREGKPMALWATKPHVMLSKCSESRALRRAFPQETSGLYIHEEMPDNEPPASAAASPKPTPLQSLRLRVKDLLSDLNAEQKQTFKMWADERGGFLKLSEDELASMEHGIGRTLKYAGEEAVDAANKAGVDMDTGEVLEAQAIDAAAEAGAEVSEAAETRRGPLDDPDDPFDDDSPSSLSAEAQANIVALNPPVEPKRKK